LRGGGAGGVGRDREIVEPGEACGHAAAGRRRSEAGGIILLPVEGKRCSVRIEDEIVHHRRAHAQARRDESGRQRYGKFSDRTSGQERFAGKELQLEPLPAVGRERRRGDGARFAAAEPQAPAGRGGRDEELKPVPLRVGKLDGGFLQSSRKIPQVKRQFRSRSRNDVRRQRVAEVDPFGCDMVGMVRSARHRRNHRHAEVGSLAVGIKSDFGCCKRPADAQHGGDGDDFFHGCFRGGVIGLWSCASKYTGPARCPPW